MECKYNQDEFCTNDQCPIRGDYCPVPDYEGVCTYEDREEEKWELTSKDCFVTALTNHITLDEDIIDFIWHDFTAFMTERGYVQEG